jgi:osmoprotectant transport system permease protein
VTVLGAVLAEEPLVEWDWIGDHTSDIRELLVEHIQLTAIAVGLGFAIAMVLALASVKWRWLYPPLAGLCGVLYSIPSLALFGLLVPITGLGFVPSGIALVSYTLLILLRNIVAGLDAVPDAVREAADGMGYEGWRRMLRIDLPLAAPTILAGLRIATVTTIGLVTVTALVGGGGFGDLINDGLSRQFSTPVVVGAVLSVALAIAFDIGFVAVERVTAPWLRAERAQSSRAPGRRRRDRG